MGKSPELLVPKIEEKLQKQLCALKLRRAAFDYGLFLFIGAAHEIAEGYLVNIRKSHETSRFGPYIR